ncbi:sugar ABC transporter permease [Microbacterium sp. Leaf347]|nr:sugar ABC transporter permease [Microbacterium sp. Leaf351]KQR95810.1 sugar ABC transporter permease [Microbacterium sp. Leaf347]ODU52997.1 MAG: sugar ABC transporter permease [Microbacterium sp. SCN 70-10]OJU74335.1 MAG: sugar ABC transporter permease [Microbacterium sp. 71-23]
MSRRVGRPRSTTAEPRRRRRFPLTPYVFLAPGMAMFILLIAYPMVKAFQMSLYDWNVVAGSVSTFIGFDNYTRAFHDPLFWQSTVNSGLYMLLTVPPQIILGLLVAILLNRRAPGRALYRVLFYLPVVTSWVVVTLLFQYLFADKGIVNWFLTDVTHATSENISWLSGRWTAMIAISALGVWKGVGWSMMIFLAALQGVSKDLLEAAELDGAGRWNTFRAAILPAIRPALLFVTVMLVIGGLNVFVSVLLMTGGGPADSTQVLLTYMYKQAFSNLDFGYGSAIAVLLTIGVFILSGIQLRLFRGDAGELS